MGEGNDSSFFVHDSAMWSALGEVGSSLLHVVLTEATSSKMGFFRCLMSLQGRWKWGWGGGGQAGFSLGGRSSSRASLFPHCLSGRLSGLLYGCVAS